MIRKGGYVAKILVQAFEEEGLKRVYDNDSWIIGMKNYKPANDIANLDRLERHNRTDEIFVLTAGVCVLISAEETGGKLKFDSIDMEANKVYVIPRGLWHTTVTRKDTRLILIEAADTSEANSDVLMLKAEDVPRAVANVKAAGFKG
jgi:mannose-6-phosphate isomerase-like protein (cupin superfamily)